MFDPNVINVLESNFKDLKLSSESSAETFDFISLPWVCQKRFAEICDPETLKSFALIKEATRLLAKRRHTIEKAVIDIDNSSCTFSALCYCNENELCNGEKDMADFKNKMDVIDTITIFRWNEEIITDKFIQHLPITFNSYKRLELDVFCIDFDALKTLINPRLKIFTFEGGIRSNCPMKEFLEFIKFILNLDNVDFLLYHSTSSLHFANNGFNFLFEAIKFLKQDKIINTHGIKISMLNGFKILKY